MAATGDGVVRGYKGKAATGAVRVHQLDANHNDPVVGEQRNRRCRHCGTASLNQKRERHGNEDKPGRDHDLCKKPTLRHLIGGVAIGRDFADVDARPGELFAILEIGTEIIHARTRPVVDVDPDRLTGFQDAVAQYILFPVRPVAVRCVETHHGIVGRVDDGDTAVGGGGWSGKRAQQQRRHGNTEFRHGSISP